MYHLREEMSLSCVACLAAYSMCVALLVHASCISVLLNTPNGHTSSLCSVVVCSSVVENKAVCSQAAGAECFLFMMHML